MIDTLVDQRKQLTNAFMKTADRIRPRREDKEVVNALIKILD